MLPPKCLICKKTFSLNIANHKIFLVKCKSKLFSRETVAQSPVKFCSGEIGSKSLERNKLSKREDISKRNEILESLEEQDAQELVGMRVIRPVSPSEANKVILKEGYKLLDVRPAWEWERASVAGSYHIPLFIEDEDPSYLTLFKKSIQMGYGGLWMGQKLTAKNKEFFEEVRSTFPRKDQKIIVACGEGLRSLLALDELHNEGYTNLAWIDGGFSKSRSDHFPDVQGPTMLQFANIGGVAEYLVKFLLFGQRVIGSMSNAKSIEDKNLL